MIGQGLAVPAKNQGGFLGGMVAARPLSALLQDEIDAAARATKLADDPVVSSLSEYIRKHWGIAKRAKESVEKEMLQAMRSRRGEYAPDKLQEIRQQGGSDIYMMVFATKARQLKALMTDILVAAGTEKPWTINPTPVPELPPADVTQIMQAVQEQVFQAEMAGMPMDVATVRQMLQDAKADLERRVMEQARRDAERTESVIEDVLVEGQWLDALDQFIDDMCVFKTAIMKGPVVRMIPQLTWAPDGTPVTDVKPQLMFERVDPLMAYPMPWAKSVHDAPFIERHRLSRQSLSQLIGAPGYNEDAIRAVLSEHGTGGLREWLSVDSERAEAEGRDSSDTLGNESELIDALQYWGTVSGKMLREWGMGEDEVQDTAREYEVECWLIGKWVIKAVINPDPLARRPYYTDGFSRIPGAFWHNSLYDVVRDCEDMANGAARALANNMGISSGPQTGVNIDRIPQGEEITTMFPWKLWQFTNDPMGSSAAPIQFFQPQSNANELMAVFQQFSQIADEVSGIPKYMAGFSGGEGGAGRTASGMSMMVGNASKQIKQVLNSLDLHVISQSVERTHQWMLQYKPDSGIKGDVKIRARGATSLIAKETAQVRINEFLAATANPIDMQIIGLDGRAELLRHAAKRLDVNTGKVVPSESAVKVKAAQAQQQMMLQQQQEALSQQPQQQGNGQSLMDNSPVVDNFSPSRQ